MSGQRGPCGSARIYVAWRPADKQKPNLCRCSAYGDQWQERVGKTPATVRRWQSTRHILVTTS